MKMACDIRLKGVSLSAGACWLKILRATYILKGSNFSKRDSLRALRGIITDSEKKLSYTRTFFLLPV